MKRCMGLLILTALLCLLCAGTEEAGFSAAIPYAAAENLTGSENTLPDNIERIESQAFTGAGLERVLLPRSLKYIADDAFDANVRFIVYADSYAASWAPFDRIDEVIGGEPEDWREILSWEIMEEDGQRFASITGYEEDQETVMLPDELEGAPVWRIGSGAFHEKTIKHIRFPAGLREIGNQAFVGCTHLLEVTIPDTVTVIGEEAFLNCSALTNVFFSAQLEEIGSQAFGSCTQLLEARIPDTVTVIGSGAFSHCSALRRVVLPALLENVNVPIFIECSSLNEVTMSVNFQASGTMVFYECPNVETIHYLAGNTGKLIDWVAKDGSYLEYQSRRSLTTVDFGEGITYIGSNVFDQYGNEDDCFVLKTLLLPSTLKIIDDSAFRGLTHLTDVTLPDGLEILGNEAFAHCSSLVPPEVPSSAEQGDNVFYGCYGTEQSGEGEPSGA